jgi:hypothetical protein
MHSSDKRHGNGGFPAIWLCPESEIGTKRRIEEQPDFQASLLASAVTHPGVPSPVMEAARPVFLLRAMH